MIAFWLLKGVALFWALQVILFAVGFSVFSRRSVPVVTGTKGGRAPGPRIRVEVPPCHDQYDRPVDGEVGTISNRREGRRRRSLDEDIRVVARNEASEMAFSEMRSIRSTAVLGRSTARGIATRTASLSAIVAPAGTSTGSPAS